jgi:hypothetical protein
MNSFLTATLGASLLVAASAADQKTSGARFTAAHANAELSRPAFVTETP